MIWTSWQDWIRFVWPSLVRGKRILAPIELGPPEAAGFYRIPIAEKVGQVGNWGLSLPDGSRIHLHELSSGEFVAHRDRHDPQRGFVRAALHLATETRVGRAAAIGGAFWGASKLLRGTL